MIKNGKGWIFALMLGAAMAVNVTACGKAAPAPVQEAAAKEETVKESEPVKDAEPEEPKESEKPKEEPAEPKPADNFSLKASPDKYTQYMDKYIGMNAATVGYSSLGGDRLIRIGDGLLEIIYVTADGSYISPEDEEALKKYVIVDQSLEPNTEVKLTFEKDDEGNEYGSLIEHQSYEKIDLLVKEVGSDDPEISLTTIEPSPDKYTFYIQDYVGKNVRNLGYISLGGDCRDAYGDATVELKLVAEDGSFVDVTDETILEQYVVTSQNVAPNTEMKLVYETDSSGKEYSNLVDSQSYDSITLTVRPVSEGPVVSKKEAEPAPEEAAEPSEEKAGEETASGSGTGYEAIYNEYSQKLKEESQALLEEYRSESAGQSLDKKAELVNKKVEELAEISNEGVGKMAELMLTGGSDGYTEWSGKLYDVYMEESGKIMDEYMSTAF